MASASFKVSVIGINGQPRYTTAKQWALPSWGAEAWEETFDDMSTVVTTVKVQNTSSGGGFTNYQVEETLDVVLDRLNADTVADLTVVDDLTVNDDIHFVKELDHDIDVNASTTAATAGGAIRITGGTGATSGAGGAVTITGGTAGATAASVGGAVTVKSGVSGAGNGASGVLTLQSGASTAAATGAVVLGSGVPTTSGNSGTVTISSGAATTGDSGAVSLKSGTATTGNSGAATFGSANVTTGNSGAITIVSGNSTTGNSGDITLSPGTASAVVGKINMSNSVVFKHKTAAINATATMTAKECATGYITTTSAAAVTMTLPTGTLLGAELGAAQGTVHDLFIDNTAGANTVTIAVAVNGILSAAAAANAGSQGLLTVPSGVTGQACFRLMFSSATAYTFTRIA